MSTTTRQSRAPLIIITLLCVFNGMYHPHYEYAFRLILSAAPSLQAHDYALISWVTDIFIATITLLASMIPPALYEKWRNLAHSSAGSLALWFGTTGLLIAPTVMMQAQVYGLLGK